MHFQSLTVSCFVNDESCELKIHGNQLYMRDFIITLEHNVKGIVFGCQKFFLIFETFLSNDCRDMEFKNNMSAYDYNGNYLYDVGELIQTQTHFVSARINVKTSEEENIYPQIPIGHEYMTCFCFDRSFILDITDDQLITVEDLR